jgi:coenzyme F420-dependent glucose-6-phosphate dehydrogenase
MDATIGYSLSGEEQPPSALILQARRAEETGFEFAVISDHFHPWTDRQGQSPFVWSVIGAIAQVTGRLRLGTGVTCPTMRLHPAIVAHAAATCAAMMPGRFFLGVGTGEYLNEHIFSDAWPSAAVRREMLDEAVGIVRELWSGRLVEHYGRHFTVENARLYTRPEEPPPIMVAAAGPAAAELAGRIGDGLFGVAPDADVVERFEAGGGRGKPRYGQIHVCWADSEAEARRTAHRCWPNAGLGGALGQWLPQPAHFEQAAELVREEDVAELVPCGPDPGIYVEAIERFAAAGFSHIYLHQIGPDQEGFFGFFERELRPQLAAVTLGKPRRVSPSERRIPA